MQRFPLASHRSVRLVLALAAGALTLAPRAPLADEGMWTFNRPPRAQIKARYGFSPDDKWLQHVQLASVRLAQGCSGSFVSGSGLVMTNHHCAHSCIQQLSTPARDFVKTGFYARAEADEVKCPEIEVNQLAAITDVTERIGKATAGLDGQKYNDALKAEQARIEKECATSDGVRCDVVSLYHGGEYNLYKYNRYQDVRLVFAPEFAIAFFGGDPDNFEFPRYDLDVSFLRVYENGKPAKIADHFPWSPTGARPGELTFVTGHPGGTERQLTVAELAYQRDYALPDRLLSLAQLRGELTQFGRRGAEQQRTSNHLLFGVENSFKALRGRLSALIDAGLWNSKVEGERKLRQAIDKDPAKKARYGAAFAAIEGALAAQRDLRKPFRYLEQGALAGSSDLFKIARLLVRGPAELARPNDQRFKEYRDSALPGLKQSLLSAAPIYDELEIELLRFGLTRLREELGTDDATVKKLLGKDSPDDVARRLVAGTRLKDVAVRKALWDGGQAALDASTDPMIQFARAADPAARAVRKQFEDQIESVLKKNDELIARARFEVEGPGSYPDATFTLRLSYGSVVGYQENGHAVAPITTIGGAFERATGRPPFDLPESWLAARGKLKLDTPMNFCTSNDIIGGNSGSPVIDKDGQVVGLIFDGNIQSLGGEYGFDDKQNRAVAVASQALLEALGTIYGADRIVRELAPGAGSSRKSTRK